MHQQKIGEIYAVFWNKSDGFQKKDKTKITKIPGQVEGYRWIVVCNALYVSNILNLIIISIYIYIYGKPFLNQCDLCWKLLIPMLKLITSMLLQNEQLN